MKAYWASKAYEDEWHVLLSADVSTDEADIARLSDAARASGGQLVQAKDRHGVTRPCHIKAPLSARDAIEGVLQNLGIVLANNQEEVGAPFTGFEWATAERGDQ